MKNILVLILIAISLISCEETVTDVTLPYKENLVIRGVLEAGSSIQISVTKTLPPLDEYSLAKALVSNAQVFVTVDGIKYECKIDSFNNYVNPLIIEAGKKYILDVYWNNKHAYSETVVPLPTKINSFKRNIISDIYFPSSFRMQYYVNFEMKKEFCYNASSEVYLNNTIQEIRISDEVYKILDNKLTENTEVFISEYNTTDTTIFDGKKGYSNLRLVIKCYDKPFYDYFITKYGNENGLFGMSGTNTNWNVKGDGIGMFIGRSKSSIEVKK
jgi:hypothetical protein